MTKINAEVVAHSISLQGDELISILGVFPRIILAEINTHRMLSKNTSSSRAIPFNKMVETIQNDPFIPIAWQKDHSGMQGTEYHLSPELQIKTWLEARDYAIRIASNLNNKDCKVTKQLCNRLLEPFMWTTMLITGSKEGWENFFNLRCPQYTVGVYNDYDEKIGEEIFRSKKEIGERYFHSNNVETQKKGSWSKDMTDLDWLYLNKGQAEIHMMEFAECVYDVINESTPKQLQPGEWHLPFSNKIDEVELRKQIGPVTAFSKKELRFGLEHIKISTSMAARTSYTMVGEEKEISYKKHIELYDRLIAQDPPHSSPMEHCARAMDDREYESFIKGDLVFIDEIEDYQIEEPLHKYKGWCRNYKGFVQLRHLIETGKQL